MSRVCVFSPKPTFGKRIQGFEPVSGVTTNSIAAGAGGAGEHSPPPARLRPTLLPSMSRAYQLQIQRRGAAHNLVAEGGERKKKKEFSSRLRLYVYKNSDRIAHASVKHDHFVYKLRT